MEFINAKLSMLLKELMKKFDKKHKETQDDMPHIKRKLAKIMAHLMIEDATSYQQRESKGIDTNGNKDEFSATKTDPSRNEIKTSFFFCS